MGKVCLFVICMYCSIHHLSAQQEEQQTQPVQQPLVTQDDILGNMNVDYAKIKLPPLSVLYENARSTPSLQILEKEKQLQKKLLSKEKRNWLGFIHAGGSASYGIADNVASNTDVNTPLIYRYVGTEQTSWNVGGGISIPFEKLFDLRGGIKRQRIQVDIAELRKQEAYETLKIQIAHLYVQILSNIIIRKTKCFDFWERNVLFPKTKRSFFRTPTPLPCPFPLNFSLLIITKKFGNLAKNRYICIV